MPQIQKIEAQNQQKSFNENNADEDWLRMRRSKSESRNWLIAWRWLLTTPMRVNHECQTYRGDFWCPRWRYRLWMETLQSILTQANLHACQDKKKWVSSRARVSSGARIMNATVRHRMCTIPCYKNIFSEFMQLENKAIWHLTCFCFSEKQQHTVWREAPVSRVQPRPACWKLGFDLVPYVHENNWKSMNETALLLMWVTSTSQTASCGRNSLTNTPSE